MTGPWIAGEQPREARKHAPATLRNRDAIGDVLARHLPDSGTVLEVASGSGEHCACFARRFPALTWQPGDPDETALASIAAWCAGLANVRRPLKLDASVPDWPVNRADAVLCINMVHISRREATTGLFRGSGALLPSGAPLILYGPYIEPHIETAPSNLEFDRALRQRNPEWGLRSTADIDRLASENGFGRAERVPMPANNLMLIYRKGHGAG